VQPAGLGLIEVTALPNAINKDTPQKLPAASGLPAWACDLAPQLLAGTRAGLLLVDARTVLYANPMAARILGRSPSALVGVPVASLVAPSHRKAALEQLALRLAGEPGHPHDIRCLRGKDSEFDARVWGQGMELAGRRVNLVTLADVSELKVAMSRIEELANFNEITGLPNRAYLLLELDRAVHLARQQGRNFSLLSVEVPRITELAATMGFGAADTLAMAIASRLRECAGADEVVAHLGGSEFALICRHTDTDEVHGVQGIEGRERSGLGSGHAGEQRAWALRDELQAPVNFGGTDIAAQGLIGIATFPQDADTGSALLEAAQTARRVASTAAAVAVFRPESRGQAQQALRLEAALRVALPRGELSLVYQPQLALATGHIVGVEALLRWQSPELGNVSPDTFIPVAERTGLIMAIGEWVIQEACAQIVRWQSQGLPPLRVSVNISPVQFQLCDVAAVVAKALQASGASPQALGVELTESALLHDSDRVAATLRSLHDSGIEIALDDFGTGFSSLSRLLELPIDLLKIDRSFISDVTAAPQSASLTRSIIKLAHGLQIPVLAEGVETEGQLNRLAADGCDRIQGYFFSRPVSADAVTLLLREGRQLVTHLAARPVRQRTLLLVDDELSVLAALKRLFRREDYTILTASSGEQALDLLATAKVDVIISDQRMPGMTGVEFLRRVKALHPDTVRMTLSGFADLQSIIDAVNEGAVYKFLMKPWDDERLREHVAQAFAQKELADDNRRLQREVAQANAGLAALNERLGDLLGRQRVQASLIEAGAASARAMLDVLPAAVFGIAPDGVLAFMNRSADALVPSATMSLGGATDPTLARLIAELRADPACAEGTGHPVAINQQQHLAWLRHLGKESLDGADRGEILVLTPVQAPHV